MANAKGVLLYGNIFLRPASMGNKWTANSGQNSARNLAMINNLYIDGEIGISIGGNNPGPLRFNNIAISDNVMMNIGRSRPTNRVLAWGIEVKDWDGGEIKNNFFLHQEEELVTNVYAMEVNSETNSQNINIFENVIYGLSAPSSAEILRIKGTEASNINFNDNYIYGMGSSTLIEHNGVKSAHIFSNNFYSRENENGDWFKDDSSLSFEDWTTTYESNAKTFDISEWPEPSRDIETYTSMLGKGATMDDFINVLYGQSKSNWDPNLTAPYINRWVKQGFNK